MLLLLLAVVLLLSFAAPSAEVVFVVFVAEEVVVVGYGTVRKKDLTGAVSTVSSDKLTQVKGVSNIEQALQGQV